LSIFGTPKQNRKSDAADTASHSLSPALVHVMKHLLLFLSLVSVGCLYNFSSSKGVKMLTGKLCCLQADAASRKYIGGQREGIQQTSKTWQHMHLP
jgi:hypothetical protein